MTSALLIGGDHDGRVINVPTDQRVVVMATAGLTLAETTVTREVPTTAYVLGRVVMFGRTVTIGLGPGVTEAERNAALIRHCLSPLARNLLDEG
jgi:hypothetical protein